MRTKTIALGFLALALLVANLQVASAHRWEKWHWNKSKIGVRNTAARQAEAEAALKDWETHTNLCLPRQNTHTDISVFDGDWGPTDWSGLATIEDTEWDWWCYWWCGVTHGHARVNTYWTGSPAGFSANIQGIFCQEIGHLFGLDHSNDGCMGNGYFNNLNTTVQHNWLDVNAYTHAAACFKGCPAGYKACGQTCVPVNQPCPCPPGTTRKCLPDDTRCYSAKQVCP